MYADSLNDISECKLACNWTLPITRQHQSMCAVAWRLASIATDSAAAAVVENKEQLLQSEYAREERRRGAGWTRVGPQPVATSAIDTPGAVWSALATACNDLDSDALGSESFRVFPEHTGHTGYTHIQKNNHSEMMEYLYYLTHLRKYEIEGNHILRHSLKGKWRRYFLTLSVLTYLLV